MPTENQPPTNKNRLSISLDYRVITIALLLVIATMLLIWKPWTTQASSHDRVVEVTGQATIKAEPDQYQFYPSYQFTNENKDQALAELTKKSDTLVAKLKELGVPDSKIKTNSNGFDNYPFSEPDDRKKQIQYTLQLTITVDNREMAQKVQDYLVTTSPTGSVSPQATFSDTKQKELESRGRDEATKDARSKADQSAKNLGFKVGKVKSVNDGIGFGGGGCFGDICRGVALDAAEAKAPQLTVQPGENELRYSVTVTYFVR